MTEEDEKTQAAFLAVITGIVLVAPTIGIYSASRLALFHGNRYTEAAKQSHKTLLDTFERYIEWQ